MFLKNCWQVAAFGSEVGRSLLARTLAGEDVVMFRTEAGEAVALEDRCAHRHVPLRLGRVVGDTAQCGYHGLCFDKEGRCVHVPGQDRIPAGATIRSFPVIERHALIWIWLGEAGRADPALVPNCYWMDDPGWAVSKGYHHVAANYALLNDNLLDLTHESFVHIESIGNEAVANAPLSVELRDGAVHASRMMLDCPPPPFYQTAAGFSGNIDRWHTTIYTPPGYCLIKNGAMPAGIGKDKARAQGLTRERRVINLLTPETERSTHYFWGIARSYDIDDEALTAHIGEAIVHTFNEDKVVLEAQQIAMDRHPNSLFPVALRADGGAIHGRRLLEAALAAEQPKMAAE